PPCVFTSPRRPPPARWGDPPPPPRPRRIDGLIVSNTTVARPAHLTSRNRAESGGLSGRPLFEPSTRLLARAHLLTGGAMTLIGCGGGEEGGDAVVKVGGGGEQEAVCSRTAH